MSTFRSKGRFQLGTTLSTEQVPVVLPDSLDNRDRTPRAYFILDLRTKNPSIVWEDDKFTLNHTHNMQQEECVSRSWLCAKYKSKACQGRITTHQSKQESDFGVIYKIKEHTVKHEKTWNPTVADRISCLQTMKQSLLNNPKELQSYKLFQRLFPLQSIAHFQNYTQLRSFLKYHAQTLRPNTPQNMGVYIYLLRHTSLGDNFWLQQMNNEVFGNKTWEQVETEFIGKHPPINTQLHPNLEPNPNLTVLLQCENEKALLEHKINYYRSKLICDNLPPMFLSSMFLAGSVDYGVILQSRHGGYRTSHHSIDTVLIDGTFTLPYFLEESPIKQLVFISAFQKPVSSSSLNQVCRK